MDKNYLLDIMVSVRERNIDVNEAVEMVCALENDDTSERQLTIPDVSNFVLLCKPNYKAKDGTIKRGIEINGKYYAPQNDC